MLEELGFDYEIRRYERNADMSAPAKLRQIHPLGKSPIVQDTSDGGTITLVETGAICEYLVAKVRGRLGPPQDLEGTLRYRQFLHYAEGSVMPVLFAVLVASKIPLVGKLAAKKIRPMLDVHLDYVESQLRSRPWFAGDDISAADVMMSFPLEAASKRAGLDQSRPATMAWLQKIHARPAYRTALERGGAYAYSR
ncbi:glutathione S-transferase (plasmid) [Aliirhizobium terrae]|uniref:glutathione S-transferase family protein n=1 Tax=Terrirhizobium terrae TaxID=2926709 RepID=UPI0025752212|nr:glutathione S-transferase [Rhizobium sp. CC-CFT758]WJH38631.1 glutathione S-transferase [Rhizobium sp. CC-CFT758]